MDLWIRTQDRTKLVKVDNISYMDMAEIYEKEVHSLWNNSKGVLGTYESEERALEVLGEIEERIMLINTINLAKDRDSLIAYKNALTEEKIKGLGYPYQMPKE